MTKERFCLGGIEAPAARMRGFKRPSEIENNVSKSCSSFLRKERKGAATVLALFEHHAHAHQIAKGNECREIG